MENVRLYVPLFDAERVFNHLKKLFPSEMDGVNESLFKNRFVVVIYNDLHLPTPEAYFELENTPQTKEISVEEFLSLTIEPFTLEPF